MSTIKALQKLDKNTNAEIYIVGGYVRDFCRNKYSYDLDIVVRYSTLSDISNYLYKYGKVKQITIHKVKNTNPVTFLSFKGKNDKIEAQISIVKYKNEELPEATLKQDGNCRDFSINAMYLPINKLDKENIIDYFKGKNDIHEKKIRTIGSAKKKFLISPIRILRAFSLAARFEYTISTQIQKSIKDNAHLLKNVSKEAIKLELEDILLSHKPSIWFKLMEKLGVLSIILPELQKCINCTQNTKYHKYNVFEHMIYACDNTKPELTLRLAALFHDIGKPISKKIINNKITFYMHEVYGEKIAAIILKRLCFNTDVISKVTHLIRFHMYHYTKEYTDVGIRRFIINSGITKKDIKDIQNFPLFLLRQADRAGNGFRKELITNRQKDFETRIINIFKLSQGFTISDLNINGKILMSIFNLKAGKEIGIILKYLLNIVITTPKKNNIEDLLAETLIFLKKKKI